ncbi:MAG TPA: histidine phosphatase family protein [Opitutaceae bacterium]
MVSQVYLVRHGETAWSESGRHTGSTEVSLTEKGEKDALALAGRLKGAGFSRVFISPRQRARKTCELAGWGSAAEVDPDLSEWDYGAYEGMRTAEILSQRPGWNLFGDGCPGGETPGQVGARADRLIGRLRAIVGSVALFSHGHFGRVLGARWAELPVTAGERLLLDTASLSILGFEHGSAASPVLALWNERPPG